ncbi:uncharacterized protein BP5553_06284 [Venustampulla echinocandica]|uniref:SUN-domain-containing protein n=1 Tax=Venustampulla echinocandica TaxID=2656787 RepID=A0A370TJH1_9HELO|nr:uncharacterized protein BP5553_06284 [Venustampulla echinocandica]RDL35672.1 hypothetical protein BP5553_06284 [Venustampulla echinocandica]
MKLVDIQATIGVAALVLSAGCEAKHAHRLSHLGAFGKRHDHSLKRTSESSRAEGVEGGLQKRGTCAFPSDAGLVAVTPGSQNAGWAMSPDQPCKPGNYCPYACPPGEVMAQWDPKATSYPSMNGGLYCDNNGQISKPFSNKPYCVPGSGALGAQSNCGSGIAFCQTVLPGNEAMLIPTHVTGSSDLAVPDTSYWLATAAHYYINPPGVSVDDGCIWGDESKPHGNWAPYVAGANTMADGTTFAKIGLNPIWTGSSLSGTAPKFGVSIECPGGGCNGLPCKIDPASGSSSIPSVTSADKATGAGGADFCVVTVPKGGTAKVVVFNAGSDSSSSGSSSSKADSSSPSPSPSPSPTPSPTPTPTPTPSSSSAPAPPSSTPSSSSSEWSSSSSSSSSSKSSSSTIILPSNGPHILFQNQSSLSSTLASASGTGNLAMGPASTAEPPKPTTSKKSAASTMFVSSTAVAFTTVFALASAYLF